MNARLAALLVACLLLAAPAAAPAQQSPFGPIPQAPAEPAPAPQDTSPSSAEDDGLSSRQQLLIALAGIVLVAGIAVAILRDARQNAPAERHGPVDEEGQQLKGTRAPPKQRVKQGRQKAKAARQARKRNR